MLAGFLSPAGKRILPLGLLPVLYRDYALFNQLDTRGVLCYTSASNLGLSTTRPWLLVTGALTFVSGGMLAGVYFFVNFPVNEGIRLRRGT